MKPVSLRSKIRILLIVFGFSAVVNVLVSAWCIQLYISSATVRFQKSESIGRQAEQFRVLVHDLVDALPRIHQGSELPERYQTQIERIDSCLAELKSCVEDPDIRPRMEGLEKHVAQLDRLAQQSIDAARNGRVELATGIVTDEIRAGILPQIDVEVWDLAERFDAAIQQAVEGASKTQTTVAFILVTNAVMVILLAAIGLQLANHWILRPIDRVREATEQIGQGNLDYRLDGNRRDEFGTLSRQVNFMAGSLAEAQQQLVQQERLAAIGEVASTIAHNIRNPLAGIRATAQSSMHELDPDSEACQQQMRIIETVDAFSGWLKDFLSVDRVVDVRLGPVDPTGLIQRVVTVYAANAERRQVQMSIEPVPASVKLYVDARHIEQALAAVVGNAIDASPDGGTVRIWLEVPPDNGGCAILAVSDSGSGIPNDMLDRVFVPYFSSKPGGTGIGLYQTRKIVEAHQGQIEFVTGATGTTFSLKLPTQPSKDA